MILAISRLIEEPYASVICYPRVTKAEVKKRLKQLQALGIDALEFTGTKQVLNVRVLGKGCVGIVTIAHRNQEKVALKIRRVDADRCRMQREAELLKKANSVKVGPKFLDVTNDFLLMQFVEGKSLPEWLEKKSKMQVRRVVRHVLQQCWRLDMTGLDHGELSHAPKHVIVDKHGEPFIVDFETASVNRKPSNVTSICQFLFISGIAEKVAQKIGEKNKNVIIEALRHYKSHRDRENFERVLTVCGL